MKITSYVISGESQIFSQADKGQGKRGGAYSEWAGVMWARAQGRLL
jgi:hypothetical protein